MKDCDKCKIKGECRYYYPCELEANNFCLVWHKASEPLPKKNMNVLLRFPPSREEREIGLGGHYRENIWLKGCFAFTVVGYTHWAEIEFNELSEE